MSKVTLVVDTRERKVIDRITAEFAKPHVFKVTTGYLDLLFNDSSEADVVTRQIPVADYAILHNDKPLAIIERKTLADFASSFKDNRDSNRIKLLNFRNEASKVGVNCKVYYLIEGDFDPDNDTLYAGIKYGNIHASIHDLQIMYDIHILRTKNKDHTARELRFLCESYLRALQNKEFIIGAAEERSRSYDEILQKAKPTTDEQFDQSLVSMWASIKGISANTGAKLAQTFTFAEWLENTHKDCSLPADVRENYINRVNEFRINDRKSKVITELLTNYPTRELQVSILSKVRGISEKTSGEICTQTDIISFIGEAPKIRIGTKATALGKAKTDAIKRSLTSKLSSC